MQKEKKLKGLLRKQAITPNSTQNPIFSSWLSKIQAISEEEREKVTFEKIRGFEKNVGWRNLQ
jgi:hypothetical protein